MSEYNVSPARFGWWNTAPKTIGNHTAKLFPLTAGEVRPIANCDALGHPAPTTVTLSRVVNYDTVENCNCDMRAVIVFGSGNASRELECDYQHGAQITVATIGQVRVFARSYAPIPGLPYLAGDSSYELGASIGLYSGTHPQPRYTQRLAAITDTSSIITPPVFSDAVEIIGTPGAESNVYSLRYDWIDPSGQIFAGGFVDETTLPAWRHIPATGRLLITNLTEETQLGVTLLWRIAA